MGSCAFVDSTLTGPFGAGYGTYPSQYHNNGYSNGGHFGQVGSPFSNMNHCSNSPMSPGTQGMLNINMGGIHVEDCEEM